jgi:hypothetical protein
MRFYCGVSERQWNHHNPLPGSLACISPVVGASDDTKRENRVKLPAYAAVIQDSGAFCDGPGSRLEFPEALDRLIEHGERWGYAPQITHRASYDLLIDEMWTAGNRYKRRWSENDAWQAVDETIKAAEYMSRNYHGPRILSAQGVTCGQYVDCTLTVLPFLDMKQDIFGLGGWCISGVIPAKMREPFDDTMTAVIPLLAKHGVKRAHIWGVLDPRFLAPLLWLCDQHGIELSTDSAGPNKRPSLGTWGYRGWFDTSYKTPPPEVRGIWRGLHVIRVREWLRGLRQTEYYRAPVIRPKQLFFDFGEVQ